MPGNQLPGLAHVDGLNQFRLSQFFGFDHRLGAQNGYIWDMHNLTGDYAPVLASRPPRWTVRPVAKPNGLYCSGKRFLVAGTALTVDGQEGIPLCGGDVIRVQSLDAGLRVLSCSSGTYFQRLRERGFIQTDGTSAPEHV